MYVQINMMSTCLRLSLMCACMCISICGTQGASVFWCASCFFVLCVSILCVGCVLSCRFRILSLYDADQRECRHCYFVNGLFAMPSIKYLCQDGIYTFFNCGMHL